MSTGSTQPTGSSRPTDSTGSTGPPRPTGTVGPVRSARRQFAAATLACLALAVIFGALTFFGLKLVAPYPLVAGSAALVISALAIAAALPSRWAYAAGSVLIVAVIATGLIHPAMFVIGGVFALLWVISWWLGGKIDRERAAAALAEAQSETETLAATEARAETPERPGA